MAARVWAAPATEGHLFHNDSVSLCLLVNRRAGRMRIFDFRAGVTASKRTFVLSTARRERIERVFIIVEREEVATWTRLGLRKEAAIPAFYKRTDGYLLGAVFAPDALPASPRMIPSSPGPDVARAESTLRRAKLQARRRLTQPAPMSFRLLDGDEGDARKAIWSAGAGALTAFEPFGRDSLRTYFAGTLKGEPTFWISAEIQPCFDHALIEFLSSPRTDRDWTTYRAGLEIAATRLAERGVVCMFAFSAIDDVALASVFVAAGFHRTGVLAGHLTSPGGRKDAFLWTRKHAIEE
jgi:hypothetical protein